MSCPGRNTEVGGRWGTWAPIVPPTHRQSVLSESDCKAAVENRPVCANSSWDMYALEKGTYFCCPKDYFGFHRKSLKKTLVPKPQEAYDAGFPPPTQHQATTPAPDMAVMIMPPPVYSRTPGQPELGGTQMIEMPTNRT
ncbi:hypothetical protein B0T16DRAFT_459871 [Cercophora newfieldiana]|uniref:Uncharacterized protein n=1 Tax=Cercophora newfieldiana TaxID=92897 RepID=A0AA40CME4_9PEZI|nr:hypothetical protein B0T16DRAFT_459871 [Cercophora newfieldiana]